MRMARQWYFRRFNVELMSTDEAKAIPGSHLWDSERVPKVEEAVYATMNVGDAFCMLGGLYHAGGHNLTKDQKRPLHGMFFCRGYLRTEVG